MNITRYTFVILLLPLLLASCAKEGPSAPVQSPEGILDGMIAFAAETPDVVDFQTRAAAVTSLTGTGFYASATKGSAGSETSVWTSTLFGKDTGPYYTGGKYWNNSNIGYHFYASNVALSFAAGGTTVAATNATDVVCAYLPSPNYKLPNTLTFQHIFARIGSVTVTAASGYTISNVSMTIFPKTGGTYNLRTGAWSSVTTGSSTQLANSTPGTKSNDLYLVPDEYDIVMSWTAAKGNYSQSFSKTYTGQSIVGGKVNDITAEFTGDARDVRFLVSVSNWNASAVALGEYDGSVPPPSIAGLYISPGPLYYDGSAFVLKDDDWNHDSYNLVRGKSAGSYMFTFYQLGTYFDSRGQDFGSSSGSIDNANTLSYGGYSDWRMPTQVEWRNILSSGTTYRNGSTVNGLLNKHFVLIKLTGVTHAGTTDVYGILIFPDDCVITGRSFEEIYMDSGSYVTTDVTEVEINEYLEQGCAFIPGSGHYSGATYSYYGNGAGWFWSASSNNSSNAYEIYFGNRFLYEAHTNDKGGTCNPVRLVRDVD